MKLKKSLLFTALVLLGVFGPAIHGFAQEEAVAAAVEAAAPDEITWRSKPSMEKPLISSLLVCFGH